MGEASSFQMGGGLATVLICGRNLKQWVRELSIEKLFQLAFNFDKTILRFKYQDFRCREDRPIGDEKHREDGAHAIMLVG